MQKKIGRSSTITRFCKAKFGILIAQLMEQTQNYCYL